MKRQQLANLTSNVLNPFLVSLVIIPLITLKSTTSVPDAIKWSLVAIAVSILPVFLIILYLVRNERLDNMFINARQQRNKIYLLAGTCAIMGCVILLYSGAPLALVASFVAGISVVLVFMGINLLWKISVHAAFISASASALIIFYGSIGTVSAALVPPIAWARVELEHHSIAQVATGALLSASIVVAVFHFFGLL